MKAMDREDVRVVVVDDHRDLLDALSILLELDGYNVRTAADVESALATIETFQPVCVLTDIDMGGPRGLELASKLRDQYGSDITLIAMTGWGEADERVSAKFADFDYYLRKPIDSNGLRRLLPPVLSARITNEPAAHS